MRPTPFAPLLLTLTLGLLLPQASSAGRTRGGVINNHERVGFETFASPQSNPLALSPDGALLYVANTTSDTVSVISTASNQVVATVSVGLEPVSVAVRPDGLEVWVSNHVSDSVSVIDTDPASPTFRQVVETIQDFDAHGATLFDEPVGIAFASNTKAYVALSSRDDIAVIDAVNYAITGRLHVTAQDPRAITVRDGLLYVASFESGNQTQISACTQLTGSIPPDCTLSLSDLLAFVTNPNLPGRTKNIIVDTALPDRDLFVYRTDTDALVAAVQNVGTLLYGVAAGPGGKVYVTETFARNAVNGLDNGGGELVALDNRMFLDEVARATCTLSGCTGLTKFALNPAPPAQPAPGSELATPYGIAASGDGNTLVATAAGTSRLFTMNATTGAVLGILDLGSGASFGQQIPRGVALLSAGGGTPQTAYVLDTLENNVAVVDVANPVAPSLLTKINVGSDPTPAAVRRGNIAFNNAFASSSGTFSCGSCHPDGNTDQLLWRIGGACFFSGCDGGDEPRTTMPIRGLKNTVPLHWDGSLGDPFDNTPNGATGNGSTAPASCSTADGDQHDCFLDLVGAALSGVMCDQNPSTNPAGCPDGGNELDAAERDDMASFLEAVAYPPARSRRMNDTLSKVGEGVEVGTGGQAIEVSALQGFKDFFTDQGGNTSQPDTCADSDAGCHPLPLGASTNSATLNGFDAPTMRGMTDRFVQFSLAPTGSEKLETLANSGFNLFGFVADPLETPIQYDPAKGLQEITTFGTAFIAFQPVYGPRPLDIFQMFEEASTQFPGATGRQVTLNQRTTGGGLATETEDLMNALEQADFDGLVNLRAEGIRNGSPVLLSYRETLGVYRNSNDTLTLTHGDLLAEAQAGTTVLTLTAALRSGYGKAAYPQPLLSTATSGAGATGDPPLPQITAGGSNPPAFTVRGLDVRSDAVVLVDGVQVSAALTCTAGTTGSFCTLPGGYTGSGGNVSIDLASRPAPDGLHLLQVRNGPGPLSDEMPICVGNASGCK
jgi:YVTN family beta-propeller protein